MNTRIDQWNHAIDAELQELVEAASNIRRNITEAKTDAKRVYYGKKFKKVQADVMRMLITRERLSAKSQPEATNASNDA